MIPLVLVGKRRSQFCAGEKISSVLVVSWKCGSPAQEFRDDNKGVGVIKKYIYGVPTVCQLP